MGMSLKKNYVWEALPCDLVKVNSEAAVSANIVTVVTMCKNQKPQR